MNLDTFLTLAGVCIPVLGAIIHLYSQFALQSLRVRTIERNIKRMSALLNHVLFWSKENGMDVNIDILEEELELL